MFMISGENDYDLNIKDGRGQCYVNKVKDEAP